MKIPEKYLPRYERLAVQHPWLNELQEVLEAEPDDAQPVQKTHELPASLPSSDETGNVDSREELVADVKKWCGMYAYQVDMVLVWLNRQAAITRHEVLCNPDERDEQIAELQEDLDNANEAIALLNAENAELRGKVDFLEKRRSKAEVRCALAYAEAEQSRLLAHELQCKLDALKAHGVTISKPPNGAYDVRNQFACDWRQKADALKEQVDRLSEEREGYRERLSRALDLAHEIGMLSDDGGKEDDMELKVKLDERAKLPERAHPTDAGADIFAPCDVMVRKGSSAIVRTGVHVQLPPNTVGMVKSKSGLNVKHGIVSEGVIDEGYTGEIVVKLYNHGEHDVLIAEGEKLTQLVVMPVLYPEVVEVAEIDGGPRGDGGFGSSGA